MLFARASLKPAKDRLPTAYLPDGYPVLFARASLKHAGFRAAEQHRHELSRAFCAGLIEAKSAFIASIHSDQLSRAFCAGLIEARACQFRNNDLGKVIPCFLRGPH